MMVWLEFCVEIQKVDLSGSMIQQSEKDKEAESDSDDDDDDLSSDSDDSDSFVHIPMPQCYQYNLVRGNILDDSYKNESPYLLNHCLAWSLEIKLLILSQPLYNW